MAHIWRVVAKDQNGHVVSIWECTDILRALEMVKATVKHSHNIHAIKFLYVEVGS